MNFVDDLKNKSDELKFSLTSMHSRISHTKSNPQKKIVT